ncbi:MAG: glycosyltransferase [Elusimicrobia bacterium]|nr:glycosyltransferase [Elusimicrobiota bacterium]
MGRPFLSVVIDNHNYGRFLREAVDGALAQDWPAAEREIIVVDDGSTDDSRAILASYGERIRPVLQARAGQAAAFNRGLAEARGEVVCLLDSDDVWRPGKLARVAAAFADPGIGFVEHRLQDVDAALRPLPQEFPIWPERYRIDDFLAGRTEFTATSGMCFRRSSLQGVLPIPAELFYYLDEYLAIGVLFKAEGANLNEILGVHRVHGGNWCAGNLADARRLAVDLRMRKIFSGSIRGWLGACGRVLDARALAGWEMETWRRRVLQESLAARPLEAWRSWREGLRGFSGSGFGRFRLATVLLAVLSPSLYLWAYSLYSRSRRVKKLRLELLPR